MVMVTASRRRRLFWLLVMFAGDGAISLGVSSALMVMVKIVSAYDQKVRL